MERVETDSLDIELVIKKVYEGVHKNSPGWFRRQKASEERAKAMAKRKERAKK